MCPTVPLRIIHGTEPQWPTAAAHSGMLLPLLALRPLLHCLRWPNKLLAPESLSQLLPEVDPRKSPPPCSCTQNWCAAHTCPLNTSLGPQGQLIPTKPLSFLLLLRAAPICPEGPSHTSLPPSPLSIRLSHLGDEGRRKGTKEGERPVSWSVFL